MIRIAIADDHAIVRWAVRQMLEKSGEVDIVGEATNGSEALTLVERLRPDVLLLDLVMPVKDGFEVLDELSGHAAPTKILVLTGHDLPAYGVRALEAGAHGVMMKSTDPTQLLAAIRKVAAGESVMPDDVRGLLDRRDAANPARILSAREREVMEYLARGYTNREIASKLAISIKTVDTHRGHVLKKLRLRNNSDLTRFAIQHGYVTPSVSQSSPSNH
jgi:DNA-binding NarL/FixJ family response regulator